MLETPQAMIQNLIDIFVFEMSKHIFFATVNIPLWPLCAYNVTVLYFPCMYYNFHIPHKQLHNGIKIFPILFLRISIQYRIPYARHYKPGLVFFFYPIFTLAAAYIADNLCTKNGNSSFFKLKIRGL